MILEQDYNDKKKSALESLREAYYKQGKTAENSTELANLNKEYGKVKEALHTDAINEADRELGASIKEADDLYRNNIITRKENNDAIIEAERKYVEKMLELGNLTDKQKSNLKAVKDELDANLKDRRNEELRLYGLNHHRIPENVTFHFQQYKQGHHCMTIHHQYRPYSSYES